MIRPKLYVHDPPPIEYLLEALPTLFSALNTPMADMGYVEGQTDAEYNRARRHASLR